MSSPRLFAQQPEKKAASLVHRQHVKRLAKLAKALATLDQTCLEIKKLIQNLIPQHNSNAIVFGINEIEITLSTLLHSHHNSELINIDNTLESNVHAARAICKKEKLSSNKHELHNLRVLIDKISISYKADIEDKREKETALATEIDIHLAQLDEAQISLSKTHTDIKQLIEKQSSAKEINHLLPNYMGAILQLIDGISHLHHTLQLGNKDGTFNSNVDLAKQISEKKKNRTDVQELRHLVSEKLQTLESLIDKIYVSFKLDISDKQIEYLHKKTPSEDSAKCSIQ